jgi:hypothetical protein
MYGKVTALFADLDFLEPNCDLRTNVSKHNTFHCYNLFSASNTLVTTVSEQKLFTSFIPFLRTDFTIHFFKGKWHGLIFILYSTLFTVSWGCQL